MSDQNEKKYGLPASVFDLDRTGDVPGISGENIYCDNGAAISGEIRIKLTQGEFHCRAGVDADGYFQLDLKTKTNGRNERRPPDLTARIFALAAHRKFIEAGYKIKGFKAFWISGSDNLDDFKKNLERIKVNKNNIDDKLNEVEAAKLTWSGMLATKLGYTDSITVVYDKWRQTVEAVFT